MRWLTLLSDFENENITIVYSLHEITPLLFTKAMSETPSTTTRRWRWVAGRWLRASVVPIRWFKLAPRVVQIGTLVTVLVGIAAGTYYAREFTRKRIHEREVAAAWRLYEEAVRKCDFPAMDVALDRILALLPEDATATGRKSAIVAEEAYAGDSDLAAALVNRHLQYDRLPEAAREARKVIANNPRHWRSLCVLATYAINVRRDLDEARRWIEALPDPYDSDTFFDAGGLLHAIQLSQSLGLDAASLRRASLSRIVPNIRSGAAEHAPPHGKIQLIDCYLVPFRDDSNLAELSEYWGTVSRFADSTVAGAIAAGDMASLVLLGSFGERFHDALARLQSLRHVPDDRSRAFAKEVNERTRRIWLAVREKGSTRHEPYAGLALLALREGQYRQGVEALLQGLEKCGDRLELLDLLAQIAEATGNAAPGSKIAWAAAERDPNNPLKWCLAATAALASGHLDSAQTACAKALMIKPNHPWARRIQTQLWLETGSPKNALQLLRQFDETAMRSDPRLVRLYARTLAECDETAAVETFAHELLNQELRSHMPPVLNVAFIRGLMDAKGSIARTTIAVGLSKRLLSYWPDNLAAFRIEADVLYRQCEHSSPPWKPDLARAALRAYARIPQPESGNPEAVAAVSTLFLKAFNDPQAALRTVEPLRDPTIVPILRARQCEILGAVYIANGKATDAVAVLERAVRNPRPTAGCWIQLSMAYHVCGRSTDARVALDRLSEFPDLTASERGESQKAKRLLESDEGK